MFEGAPAGAPIALHRESVVAFIGPAPRGPVGIPIAVRSVGEFLQRFGAPDRSSRLERYLAGYFANGGTLAIVVRVCRPEQRNYIELPGQDAPLVLEALHPGPLEFLRAAIDYDGLPPDADGHFNLTVHRLAGGHAGPVVEQELYPALTTRPESADYVGDALLKSALVRLRSADPASRPAPTVLPGAPGIPGYVHAAGAEQNRGAPSDNDLIGSREEGTGLYALDRIPRVDLLCMVSPAPATDIGPVALFTAERYCRARQAVLLMPPPARWCVARDVLADQQQRLSGSPNVISCFPLPGDDSVLGALAGALVARDQAQGCWSCWPAGGRLRLRFHWHAQAELSAGEIAAVLRAGVNPLTPAETGWIELRGGVTMARGRGLPAEWSDLRLRRTALFIIDGLAHDSRWFGFGADGDEGIAELAGRVRDFLDGLHAAGALAGSHASQAWFMRGPVVRDGALQLDIGFALRRPGEFVCYRLTQRRGACHVRELGWQPALATAV